MLLETYMRKNKWQLEKAENGLKALQTFQKNRDGFDVIFMGELFFTITCLVLSHWSSGDIMNCIDVSMPVMNGYESTRLIRSTEGERRIAYEYQQQVQAQSPFLSTRDASPSFPFHLPSGAGSSSQSSFASIDLYLNSSVLKLNKPALIIALTGFSSENDQALAFEAGVDVFMTKPVRFREVGKILEGWMANRKILHAAKQ